MTSRVILLCLLAVLACVASAEKVECPANRDANSFCAMD